MGVRAAPGMSEKSINQFFGHVTDRAGQINKNIKHFDLLKNVDSDLSSLKVRGGTSKYGGTHATGSRTHGAFDHSGSPDTNFSYVKNTDADLYFSDGSAWTKHTQHSFPETAQWYAEMLGENTYDATVNISDTVNATGTTTSAIKLVTNTSLIPNVLAGYMIKVTHSSTRIERKRILGNTADTILLSSSDPLNELPAAGIAVSIRNVAVNLYVGGGSEYGKINATKAVSVISAGNSNAGYDRLDNEGTYGYGFTGIATFANRILGWKGARVRFSDVANGDNFSKGNYFDFPSTVQLVKPFNDNVCIIYESNRIWALIGVSSASWELRLINEGQGTVYPRVAANYVSSAMTMQIFMTRQGELRAITTDTFSERSREARTLSISRNYIQESLSTFNYLAGGVTADGKFVLSRSDSTWEVLNLEASERLGFDEWIWSRHTRASSPTDFNTRSFASIGGGLVSCSNSSGQLWNLFDRSVFADNGVAIDWEISRRGLNFEQFGDKTKFYGLNLAHGPSGGSTTITVSVKAGNTPSGSINTSLGTYNPSTGAKFRRFRIPNNPSTQEGSGTHIDFKLSGSQTTEVAPLEMIQFTYFPSIIR